MVPNVLKPLKNGKGKNKSKEPTHHRNWYAKHSQKFVDWVDKMGFEKTVPGQLAVFLERRFKLRRLALLFLFSLVLAGILNSNLEYVYTGYRVGEIASTDIKSPASFEIVDERETSAKKTEAEDAVDPVYDLDLGVYEEQINHIYRAFREMRDLISQEKWPRSGIEREEKIKDFLRHQAKFEDILGKKGLSARMFEWLAEQRFHVRVEKALIDMMEQVSGFRVVQDYQDLKESGRESIVVRVLERGGGGDEWKLKIGEVTSLGAAREQMRVPKRYRSLVSNEKNRDMLLKVANVLAVPNLTLNKQETANRRQKARESVLPIVISVKKGQVVIAEGLVIQPIHVRILDEIRRLRSTSKQDFNTLLMSFLFVTIILVFLSFLRRFTLNRVRISLTDFTAMASITLTVVAVSKLVIFLLSESFQSRFEMFLPSSFFLYLIPAAASPMLVGLIITSGEVVWLFSVFSAIVMSFMVEFSFSFFIFAVVGGIAAARGVHSCKRRNDIYWAGIRTGGINFAVIALTTLIAFAGRNWDGVLGPLFWNSMAGLASGILSSFVAMTLVPLVETIFNYTTDVKLLELSNLNHPLLKEMIVRSPGTYHHSLVVGNMVEAAAEEIGANPLLAKVCAYYHDIGKMEHPGYFIENQKMGQNPHDHLSPNMSKTVLISHVKDGVELGHKYKLGKPILDVIRQHHGTTLIQYFFNKAKQSDDDNLKAIEEAEFRYPGPKPQFREAALVMLADSIEAAARSCEEPNSVRLQNIVRNIIHRKFMDAQLDECELTLKDLSRIENAFIKILLGIFHQRIDYPKSAGGGAAERPDKSVS
jgi:putative nucleotidyltransferase with HDIG domain